MQDTPIHEGSARNGAEMAKSQTSITNSEGRLGQQRKAKRIRKTKRDYEVHTKEVEAAWPRLASPLSLGEAWRFRSEFLDALPEQDL